METEGPSDADDATTNPAMVGYPVTVWTDYLCPWAYAGRAHSAWLRSQGVNLAVRAYELHPDVPPEGRAIRPGGGFDRLLDDIGARCADLGLPFTKPSRTPNTRHALELLELTATHHPAHVRGLDDALADAGWVDIRPIDDPAVLQAIVTDAGLDWSALEDRRAAGEGAELLARARTIANDHEVSGTPAWRIGPLTITGLHETDQFRRWARRLIERNPTSG